MSKKIERALLSQTGIPAADISRQLETLRHSEALEGMGSEKRLLSYVVEKSLADKIPRVREITEALFLKPREKYVTGHPRARKEAGRLRGHLEDHYKKYAKQGEIRFDIPPAQYGVFAPKAPTSNTQFPSPAASAIASILDPDQNAEVHQRVPVKGRIDALHPDLRPWLIVETPVGDHYPQCWISRSTPEFENDVRIGLVSWGADEGAVYVIHLVAVGIEGDSAFYTYMKSGRDGFGPLLPADCLLLDKKRVTRRDIRP
jgi:hypothetical protein